jgi:hypothetical protein
MTIVISCELLILHRYHGYPDVPEIFAFAGGAIAGYATVAAFARSSFGEIEPIDGHDTVRIGLTHAVAVGSALLLGVGLARIPSGVAWLLVPWAGVAAYVGLAALQKLAFGVSSG